MAVVDKEMKRVLYERQKVLQTQPLTKWISVIETDGTHMTKKRHLVRYHHTKDVDYLKTDLTQYLQPGIGPVRRIFTPAGGTEVTSLDQIEADKEYVAGLGNQKFKHLSQFLNGKNGKKKSSMSSISEGSSSKNSSVVTGRMTLMQRQDLIARKARKSINEEEPLPPITREKKPPVKKYKKPSVVSRKPLYPTSIKKPPSATSAAAPDQKKANLKSKVAAVNSFKPKKKAPKSDSAKSNVTIKGNFVRASRLPPVVPVGIHSGHSTRNVSAKSGMTSAGHSSRHSSGRSSQEGSRHGSNSRSPSHDGSENGSRGSRSPSHGSKSGSGRSRSQSNEGSRSPSGDRSRRSSAGSGGSEGSYGSRSPSNHGSRSPSNKGSRSPSNKGSRSPSNNGSRSPSNNGSRSPSNNGSRSPSNNGSRSPSNNGSRSPSNGSRSPSVGSSRSIRSSVSKSRASILSARSGASQNSSRSNNDDGGSRKSSSHSRSTRSADSRRTRSNSVKSTRRIHTSGSNLSYTRASFDRSLGQSIQSKARRSVQSGIGRDDDDDKNNHSHRTLRYGNSFSRDNSAASHKLSIKSEGAGAENNAPPSRGSIFSYKTASNSPTRPVSKPIEVDYDRDGSGLYRAKKGKEDAKEILDSTATKVDTPIDLQKTLVIDDEDFFGLKS